MLTNEQLAERIKLLRESFNLSQWGLGRRIGTHKNTVCHWENGKQRPLNSKLKKLCNEFDIPMYWFTKTEEEIKALKEGETELSNPVIKECEIIFKDGVMMFAKNVTTEDAPKTSTENIVDWSATTFGDRIKFLREKSTGKIISKFQFGRKIGVSEKSVRAWEQNNRIPKWTTLIQVAERFNVSLAWLKDGIGSENDNFNELHTDLEQTQVVPLHSEAPMNELDNLSSGIDANTGLMELYLKLSPHNQGRVLGYLDSLLRDEMLKGSLTGQQ